MTDKERMSMAVLIAIKLNEEAHGGGLAGQLLLPSRVLELSELIVFILSRSDRFIADNISAWAEFLDPVDQEVVEKES